MFADEEGEQREREREREIPLIRYLRRQGRKIGMRKEVKAVAEGEEEEK